MAGKVTLTDTMIHKLEKMVAKMEPGQRLPTETALAEKYSVGRSTIRESLKVLAYKKIITRRNEGTFVSDGHLDLLRDPISLILNMDACNLIELIELREILEVMVVRLAVRRATEEDIIALEKCEWLLQEPGLSKDELKKRDFDFHNQLAKCAENAIIEELLKAVRHVIADNLEKEPLPSHVSHEGSILHEKIISALRERNESEAVATMEEYLMLMDHEA